MAVLSLCVCVAGARGVVHQVGCVFSSTMCPGVKAAECSAN